MGLLPLIVTTYADSDTNGMPYPGKNQSGKMILHMQVGPSWHQVPLEIPIDSFLFKVNFHLGSDEKSVKGLDVDLKPDKTDLYHTVGFTSKSEKVVVIYPVFTQAAYEPHGFYDYYHSKCDQSCLTVPIPEQGVLSYSASQGATAVLSMLNYSFISDIDVDRNPTILKKYDKVIVLHNEYVTRKEFHALVLHSNVLYLYPNALYAQVQVDYDKDTLTLVKGHGYPSKDVTNAFHWKFDNSKFEYDVSCDNWKIYGIKNGKMLNCFPEYRLFYDENLLNEIKS